MRYHTHFVTVLFVLIAHCALPLPAEARPNVILILADDLGYETIGANGGTSYKTPTLDRLAATWSPLFALLRTAALYTHARVQLMTSKYNVRNYIDFGNMDKQAVTFGNLFKQAGYATCMAGKWQLGHDLELPKKYGFDEYGLWQHMRRPSRYANPGLEINGVEKDFTKGEYGPDIVNDYVLDFVSRHKDKPFFVYYPMMLTHGPYDATPDSTDWDVKGTEGSSKAPQHFADMVAYMDKLIGKLIGHLESLKLRENTLILFVGDNGTGAGTPSKMGDKFIIGGKGSTTETGMHVPLIASWPGKIDSGKVSSNLVDSTDFLPTICEVANVSIPGDLKIDGHSFLPQLKGEASSPRKWVYSWYSPRGEALWESAFNQQYKLYRSGQFFDLTHDPTETKPLTVSSLAGDAAQAAKDLQIALDQYKDARPANLPQPPRDEGAGAKAKKAKKTKAKG